MSSAPLNPRNTLRALALLPGLLLAACSGSDRGSPGSVGPGAAAEPADRYALANACFVLQDRGSGKFLAGDDGAVQWQDARDAATPFFMKPTALGRYLFYTPGRQLLSIASAPGSTDTNVAPVVEQAGWQVSGAGDVVAVLTPAQPLADALNQAGQSVGEAGSAFAATPEGGSLALLDTPGDGAEWTIDLDARGFSVVATQTGQPLGADADRYRFLPASGCTEYPEAQLNARGTPFKGRNPDGTVFGYAETHMHLGGSEALGGRLGYGRPFHRFGIPHALENCAEDHGPNGSLDALDAIVNPQRGFFPPHETQGWPTFRDWPAHGSQTHHQTYYVWLKRAWMGGLRFMMNHLVANEVICQIWPLKQHDCNEMESIALQRQLVLDLQDYIDAQEGGPGKGFFRIVYSSTEARRVIEAGQMAVVLGTENEKIFDCGEFLDAPECTREHIDAQLDEWHALGLRAIFPIHLFDNALGGSRLTEDPALNVVYQGGNILDTGHPYATVPCETADGTAPGEAPVQGPRGIIDTVLLQATGLPPAPPLTGCVENARGLTDLGDYFVNAMIDRGILIETDHSGTLARKRMLDIAKARNVPVLSGHTGFISDARDSRRILEVGGVISNLPDEPAPVTVEFIRQLAALYREVHGSTEGLATGLGSDINGIHVQAAPRSDAATRPLAYPFRSYDGRVVFERQVTGERVFDLNSDGVAHYGLYPDFLADLQQTPGGDEAMRYLFRSAEAYLQAWARAEAAARR
ncbi:MAG TPA: hypothetical protein VFV11_04810 [Solimonas sp.]|nr:hypothetical protein [Solimonas sp.]